jgi:PTS system nitrogen regulatory IIA component
MQLSIREVSRLLKVSEKRVNEWIRRGILRADAINHQYQLHRSDLLELASSGEIDVRAEIFSSTKPDDGDAFLLVDALRAGGIFRRPGGTDKLAVLRDIVDTLTLPPRVDREAVVQLLLAREAMGSTAIGEGIAIPHVRRPILLSGCAASISLYLLERPVDFGAPDDKPVFAIFLIISPTARTHLLLLSRLSFALHDSELRKVLARRAPSADIVGEFQRIEDVIRHRARKDARQS